MHADVDYDQLNSLLDVMNLPSLTDTQRRAEDLVGPVVEQLAGKSCGGKETFEGEVELAKSQAKRYVSSDTVGLIALLVDKMQGSALF